MKSKLTLAIVMTLTSVKFANSANITAVSDGNWTTHAVWSCNCQPTNADNITIPSGRTVTATGPAILILGPIITITIAGTLILNNASLQVDGNDIITISSGGVITGAGIFGGSVSSGIVPIPIASGSSVNGPSSITGGALPIKLLTFNGESIADNVKLNWASATEENFSHYNITRSDDGNSFQFIGKVEGAGNSLKRIDYEFEDIHPTAGKIYYRLEAVDLDGSKEIFAMIMIIHQPSVKQVSIFPNPVKERKLNVQLNFIAESNPEIRMYDGRGMLVMQRFFEKDEPLANIELPANLEKGIYIVEIKSAGLDYKSTVNVD
jgi:hypothetical protein